MENAVTDSGVSAAGGVLGAYASTRSTDADMHAHLDAIREQESRKARLRERIKKERRILLPLLAFVVLLVPNFGRVKVVGDSMKPQFHSGDSLMILKTFRTFSPLKPGDIVVVAKKEGETAGQELIKRVVFIQNAEGNAKWPESVETSRGPLPMRFFFPQEVMGIAKIPANYICVMGDNFEISSDSRDPEIGPIAPSEIVGKVLMR
jgi:signal peptidase I